MGLHVPDEMALPKPYDWLLTIVLFLAVVGLFALMATVGWALIAWLPDLTWVS